MSNLIRVIRGIFKSYLIVYKDKYYDLSRRISVTQPCYVHISFDILDKTRIYNYKRF